MDTPDKLIDEGGNARLGVFSSPVREINAGDFDLRTPMGSRRGALARRLALNRFQFLGGVSEQLLFGCAIVDIGYVAQAFLYLYEPPTKRFTEWSLRSPLALGCRMDLRPEDGSATYRRGNDRFAMTASESPRRRHLWVRLAAGVEVDATFDEEAPAIEPMRIATRAGATGFVYARKTAATPVSGTIACEGRRFDLAALGVLGHHDWSAGFMRRETFWNWGCLAGRLTDGRTLGMNVSCGVNETSFRESCFWLDGRLHTTGSVAFDYDRRDLMSPWRMRDDEGRLDVAFVPEGSHAEKTNALVVATNFHQLFGRYHGRLRTREGETVEVDGLLGYAEEHYAKW